MRKRAIIGTGAAAVVTAGAVLIPLMASAQAATPAATVHTYSFTSLEQKMHNFTKTSFAEIDTDVNAKGKVVGYDTVDGTVSLKAQTITGWVTVDLPGGQLITSITGTFTSPVMKGAVIGGTGAYKGAKGTVVAKNLNAAGTKTAVTIKYTG